MGDHREDWEKPRTRSDKFTPEEIAKVKANFRSGMTIADCARQLKCASSSIRAWYNKFSVDGAIKGAQKAQIHRPANYTARLYKPTSWDL